MSKVKTQKTENVVETTVDASLGTPVLNGKGDIISYDTGKTYEDGSIMYVTKTGKACDRSGSTDVACITYSINGFKMAMKLNPELKEQLTGYIIELEALKTSLKPVRVPKTISVEEAQAKVAKKKAELEKAEKIATLAKAVNA